MKKQEEVQRALDAAEREMEREKENGRRARGEWERERDAMREVISELRDSVRENYERMKKMEGKHKVCLTFDPQNLMSRGGKGENVFSCPRSWQDVKYSHENLTSELTKLMAERAESQQRIKDLEEENKALKEMERDGNMEAERQGSRAGFNAYGPTCSRDKNLFCLPG